MSIFYPIDLATPPWNTDQTDTNISVFLIAEIKYRIFLVSLNA